MSTVDDLKLIEEAQGVLIRNIRNNGAKGSDLDRLEKYATLITQLKKKIQDEKREAVNLEARMRANRSK